MLYKNSNFGQYFNKNLILYSKNLAKGNKLISIGKKIPNFQKCACESTAEHKYQAPFNSSTNYDKQSTPQNLLTQIMKNILQATTRNGSLTITGKKPASASSTLCCLFGLILLLLNLNGCAAFYAEPSGEGTSVGNSLYTLDREPAEAVVTKREFTGPGPNFEQYETDDSSKADTFIDVLKRYVRPTRGWGHRRRYPWKRLPDTMCFQQKCKGDKDCCMRHNICDRSAKVCRDCWYGSICKSEEHCCHAYPYCLRKYVPDPYRKGRYITKGKCVDTLYRPTYFG